MTQRTPTPPSTAAIVAAAGLGSRLSTPSGPAAVPKALRLVSGRTLLQRSVDALAPYVDHVVIALPPDLAAVPQVDGGCVTVQMVGGGSTRQQSVAAALAALDDRVTWVLVHDAARALVPGAVVARVLEALRAGATCAVPMLAPTDSLRRLHDDGSTAPLPRAAVRLVQTPQGFTAEVLRRAHAEAADPDATDDASLVEATGELVTAVDGDPLAFKITHAHDLVLANALSDAAPPIP